MVQEGELAQTGNRTFYTYDLVLPLKIMLFILFRVTFFTAFSHCIIFNDLTDTSNFSNATSLSSLELILTIDEEFTLLIFANVLLLTTSLLINLIKIKDTHHFAIAHIRWY